MATIFTVHGTFASALGSGEKWWQRGSVFENELRRYISAEDGELRVEPFLWNGENSERSRRAAGKDLLARLQAEEKKNRHYCLVGHSHGGSVIGHALSATAVTTQTPHLSSWTTVGTPFIETKRYQIAFFRFGSFGRSIYLFAFMIVSFYALSLFGEIYRSGLSEYARRFPNNWIEHIYEISIFSVPALFLILSTRYSRTKLRDKEYFENAAADTAVANKSLWLWHPSDEAIQALQSARYISLNTFKKDKIISAISALSILIIPALIFLVALCDRCMLILVSFWNGSAGPFGRIYTVPVFSLDRFTMLVLFYLELPYTFLKYALGPHLFYVEHARPLLASGLLALSTTISLTLLFAISWLVYMAMTTLGHALSHRLSQNFNAFVSNQVKLTAFGSDTEAEYAVAGSPQPQWTTFVPRALPDELANEISSKSDVAAADAIRQIRRALSKMGGNSADIWEIFSTHFGGNELIHTTYFDVPRFRKLVAYAIAQSKGFNATDTFKTDPDYAVVCRWYEDLRASG
jgi:hypothetical protein